MLERLAPFAFKYTYVVQLYVTVFTGLLRLLLPLLLLKIQAHINLRIVDLLVFLLGVVLNR
jgi:hypothetical protein